MNARLLLTAALAASHGDASVVVEECVVGRELSVNGWVEDGALVAYAVTDREVFPGTAPLGVMRSEIVPSTATPLEIAAAVDAAGRMIGNAQVSAPGLFEPEDPETARILREFTSSVGDLPAPLRRDDSALADAARSALRRALGKRFQKRPLVDVHLLRV